MNSIEFIEELIQNIETNIYINESVLKTYDKDSYDDEEIDRLKNNLEYLKERLKYLKQIKIEVEAWKVVKEELQIILKSKNLNGEPLQRYELNVVGKNKINTLEKALEVEDE